MFAKIRLVKKFRMLELSNYFELWTKDLKYNNKHNSNKTFSQKDFIES